ncbi:protein Mis18-beta isoform X2 [Apus apus]|uniref:protein Mis18-beta isoform X2 n=1 Tax=Apus apus TaxID=8895 RepID=UPI0021F8B7D1|nr:protein Mis18-beta isoform X2 [Apus apus]
MGRPGRRALRPGAGREKMAVRRQLVEFLRNPQLGGTIVVERPPSLGPAGRAVPPTSSAPPQLTPRQQEPRAKEWGVFHCRGCWTVLGDSLHLCAQDQRLGLLVCYKVTNDVVWEDSLMVGLEEPLLGCAHYILSCRSCGLIVGFILYSAPRDLAYLRGCFCFFKDKIFCYLLQNEIIIEASKVNFPAVTLEERVNKLKERIVKLYFRIGWVMRQLEELKKDDHLIEREME